MINFKLDKVKKDLNYGMVFVNPNGTNNQNILGHSKSWNFKKNITIMVDNYHKISMLLFFYICALLLIIKSELCQF